MIPRPAFLVSPEGPQDLRREDWPADMRTEIERALAQRHYTEGRFLLAMGLALTIISMLVDYLTMPEHMAEMAMLRLTCVIPLQIAGLTLPPRLLGLQKLTIGASLIFFMLILLHGSQIAPSEATVFLAMGVVLLFGVALPVLPFGRTEQAIFALAFAVGVGLLLWLDGSDPVFVRTFLPIVGIVAGGVFIISRRVRYLELQNMVLLYQNRTRLAELSESHERLYALSTRDPLTGLANRRHFEDEFAARIATGEDNACIALMMIDLDHFKRFNDTYGHLAGDEFLQRAGEMLQELVEIEDGLVARFGGEEFIAVIPETVTGAARALAERIRERIHALPVEVEGETITGLTTSVGIAHSAADEAETLERLIERADAALYRAKDEGRDRVVVAEGR